MSINKDYVETVNGVSFKMIFVEGGKVIVGYGEDRVGIACQILALDYF